MKASKCSCSTKNNIPIKLFNIKYCKKYYLFLFILESAIQNSLIAYKIFSDPTLDLHLFMMSMNSFLPIPVRRSASAALKFGMLS